MNSEGRLTQEQLHRMQEFLERLIHQVLRQCQDKIVFCLSAGLA